MRFLADENCDFAIVSAVRAGGHNVLAVGEFQSRSVDAQLMELAYAEERILLTEDKDSGVVLVRFPASARYNLATSVLRLVSELGPRLAGAFVVLCPGSVRISHSPFAR